MAITATELRQNLYNILDEIIKTGVPVEINRKGVRLRIVPERNAGVFDLLEDHDTIVGDGEELVHMDWSDTWKGEV